MKKKNIYTIIKENELQFTNVEKIIATYFLDNKPKEDVSIQTIRDTLFVSKASLSRFAQKCGYRGYREFIYHYKEDQLQDLNKHRNETQRVLEMYHKVFMQTKDLIDEEQLERVVNFIAGANHILTIGVSSSGLAAKEMKNRFMKHQVVLEAIVQLDDMILQSSLLDEHSLCIAISISGKKSQVLEALKQAKHVQAKTVLITGNTVDKFNYCDEIIKVPLFTYEDFITTQFPILMVLDLIYQMYIQQYPKNKK